MAQVILIASNSDGEDTIWIQILVFVVLAASWGVYSLVKTRAKQFGGRQQYYSDGVRRIQSQLGWQIKRIKELKDKWTGTFLKGAQPKVVLEGGLFDSDGGDINSLRKVESEPANGKDLAGGMEMLELDFLLGVIENTKGKSKNDVMMRKLSFGELLRREQLKETGSKTLKVYATDKDRIYGKDIQCGAMKELSERTVLRRG